MNSTEFQTWFKHHASGFSALAGWFTRIKEDPPDGMPSRADTFQAWHRALRSTAVEDAIEASDRMFGDPDLQPSGYTGHPGAVARLAARIRTDRRPDEPPPRYHDGEQAYVCVLCKDIGTLTVYQQRTLALANRTRRGMLKDGEAPLGTTRAPGIYTVAVKCTCQAGERASPTCLEVFNEAKDLIEPIGGTRAERFAQITEFASKAAAPPSHTEFDEFGG